MFWHCETITREATKAIVQVTTAASATAKAAATVAEAVAGPAAVTKIFAATAAATSPSHVEALAIGER